MDLDEVFTKLCPFGPIQKKVFAVTAVLQVFTAFQIVHNVFIGAQPEFFCVQNGKEYEKCGMKGMTCESFRFPGNDFTSVVSEWSLVCESGYRAQLIQSFLMGGYMVGSVLFGWLADRYGRRGSVVLSVAATGVFSAIGAVSWNYAFYVTMRFLVGVCIGGFGLVSFVLLTEMIGSSKRGLASMVMPFAFACGIMIYALIAYFVTEWRTLTFITSAPGLAAVYLFIILPESPRWLFSQNRVKEAEAIVEKFIASMGSKEVVMLKEPSNSSSPKKAGDSVMSLLLHSELRKRTVISVIVWFVVCATYYGLTMGAGNLGGNMYLSVAGSGFVEIPAYMIGAYIINKFGRRHSITWTMVLGGIACLIILTLPLNASGQKSLCALLGKMCISIAFSVAWCYSAELYPTSIRNQGMSVCNMAARLGGVLSPMLIQLSQTYPSVDYLIFGSLSLISGFMCLKLPETLNQQMPENVSDLTKLLVKTATKQTTLSGDKIRLLEEEIKKTDNQDDLSDYEITL